MRKLTKFDQNSVLLFFKLAGEIQLHCKDVVLRPGMVVRVRFNPCSISDAAWNFNFCPVTQCVSFVCVVSCVFFGGSPDNSTDHRFQTTPLLCNVWCFGPKSVLSVHSFVPVLFGL